jgi:hypothetical protein
VAQTVAHIVRVLTDNRTNLSGWLSRRPMKPSAYLTESYGMDRSRPGDLDPDVNPAN